MEYEKKYRDLVEAVKELQEANPHDEGIQKWVEDNVPQLAKSKDEKTRKYLIILLQHFCKGYRVPGLEFPISFKDMLIWLEKQKPMEDFNGDDYGIDSLWHAIRILEKTLGEVEGYQTDDGILEHKCAITAVRKLAKERREQKPVPKFEVGDVMRTLQEAADNITSGLPVVVSINDEYYRCNNELIAIKDQDDYEYPPMNRIQKPAWKPSEEDGKTIDIIISFLEEFSSKDYIVRKHCINWLKSLKDGVGCEVNCTTTRKSSDEHYELEEFAKIVRCNLTGISKSVQQLFEAKYLQLTGNKMYEGFKD